MGQVAAQGATALVQVVQLVGPFGWPVVGRQGLVESVVGDGQEQPIAETEQVLAGQLFHLVGGVAAFEV